MLSFFEYNLVESLDEVIDRIHASGSPEPVVVNCMNPHSFVLARGDQEFHDALVGSDCLLPDGEGVCWAVRKTSGKQIKKIAGDDLHNFLLKHVDDTSSTHDGGRIYYMGSTAAVLEKIEKRINREHPALAVRTYSPPFCKRLSDDDSQMIVDDINSFKPDVVFVGLGAPKQEKWAHQWTSKLDGVRIVAGIGAVFDFYSGAIKRPSALMVGLKLEWLGRFMKEPRRMWNRVFVTAPRFARYVLKNTKKSR